MIVFRLFLLILTVPIIQTDITLLRDYEVGVSLLGCEAPDRGYPICKSYDFCFSHRKDCLS